ncbi:hypothetical protein Tco_0568938 [Tanacetum coccineum]
MVSYNRILSKDWLNPKPVIRRMAKDRFVQSSIKYVNLHLIGTRQHIGHQYNLPTASEVAALKPCDENLTNSCDVIVEERELPYKVDDLIEFNAVRSHMMHGPCGDLYKSAHGTLVKYVFSYLNKGPDRATIVTEGQRNDDRYNNTTTTTNINSTTSSSRVSTNSNTTTPTTTTNNNITPYRAILQHENETNQYFSYYIYALESCWHLLGYEMQYRYVIVERLPIHEEAMVVISSGFRENTKGSRSAEVNDGITRERENQSILRESLLQRTERVNTRRDENREGREPDSGPGHEAEKGREETRAGERVREEGKRESQKPDETERQFSRRVSEGIPERAERVTQQRDASQDA